VWDREKETQRAIEGDKYGEKDRQSEKRHTVNIDKERG